MSKKKAYIAGKREAKAFKKLVKIEAAQKKS
jgi:hypothetical protein